MTGRKRSTEAYSWWKPASSLALVAIALWGLTGSYLVRERLQQLEFAEAASRIQVRLLAEHTASVFRQIELGLRAHPTLDPGSLAAQKEQRCPELRRTVLDLPGVDNAVILLPTGELLCSLRDASLSGFPDHELIRNHRDELRGFSIVPASSSRGFLTLGVRLDSEDGELAGILAATVSRDYFSEWYRDYGTVNADMIALYDPERAVLARWPAAVADASLDAEPLLDEMNPSELVSGGLRSWSTGESVVSVFQLPGFAYRIAVVHAKATVLSGWRDQLHIIGGGALLLGATLVVAGGWIQAGRVRRQRSERELAESLAREQDARISRLEGLRALAGGLAHDINNGMMVVLGNTELLKLDCPAGTASTALHSIRDAAHRASALSERMLAVAGHANMKASVFDLGESVASFEPELRRIVVDADDEFTLQMDDSNHLIRGDSDLVRSAIRSLVENATEAGAKSGTRITLTVRAEQVDGPVSGHLSDTLQSGRYVTVEVRDDGDGMDPSLCDRVFDPFYTARFLGRGLGLSAAAGIARQHGGAVAIETEPGTGTKVTFYVPSAAPQS